MIQAAVEGFLRFLRPKIDEAAHLAASGGGQIDGIIKRAYELRQESEQNLRRQLEIHRFTFTVPQTAALDSTVPPTPIDPDFVVPAPPTNCGGKPLAEHWDGMWAAIAVMLYTGDLQPKTQADIERAMKDRLAESGRDVADSAVRTRAQKLWAILRAAD